MTKGTSVCRRSVIRKDVIEGMLLEEIGSSLRTFLAAEQGRPTLRTLLEQMLPCDEGLAGMEGEREKLCRQNADVERRIFAILDNITAENREFADKRIRELKTELREITPRLQELEAASLGQVDLDGLTDAMVSYMGEFEKVLAEGTIDEKRSFMRAFTKEIELDPQTGKGRAQLFMLPDPAAATRNAPATANSSLIMVAGAGFEPATFRL